MYLKYSATMPVYHASIVKLKLAYLKTGGKKEKSVGNAVNVRVPPAGLQPQLLKHMLSTCLLTDMILMQPDQETCMVAFLVLRNTGENHLLGKNM